MGRNSLYGFCILKKKGLKHDHSFALEIRWELNHTADEVSEHLYPASCGMNRNPWFIHRPAYRHTPSRQYPCVGVIGEKGAIGTAFDITILNDLDRFDLVIDANDKLQQFKNKTAYLKQEM